MCRILNNRGNGKVENFTIIMMERLHTNSQVGLEETNKERSLILYAEHKSITLRLHIVDRDKKNGEETKYNRLYSN